MEELKLIDFKDNETINNQMKRGRDEQNPFESEAFKEANKISLDITYMFDTPEESSIGRKDIEGLIPRVMEAHNRLKNDDGDIRAVVRSAGFTGDGGTGAAIRSEAARTGTWGTPRRSPFRSGRRWFLPPRPAVSGSSARNRRLIWNSKTTSSSATHTSTTSPSSKARRVGSPTFTGR